MCVCLNLQDHLLLARLMGQLSTEINFQNVTINNFSSYALRLSFLSLFYYNNNIANKTKVNAINHSYSCPYMPYLTSTHRHTYVHTCTQFNAYKKSGHIANNSKQ